MTFNEKMIRETINGYRNSYFEKFGVYPSVAFSYLRWLSDVCLSAHNFTMDEYALAEKLLNN